MISKKSKYAINALVFLAKNQEKGPIPASTIAESENIPPKFLEAILLDLKKSGILSSKKGASGGYYLHQTAEEINMADVMRLFDGAIAYLPCVTYKYYERCEECKDEVTCGIRDAFLDLRNKTVEMLKGNTLADLINRERKLKEDR